MRTKTEKAINLFESGCLKEALSIFRTFRIGFTKEERRTLKIAYECLSGSEPNGSVLYAGYGESGPDTYWVVGTINWV